MFEFFLIENVFFMFSGRVFSMQSGFLLASTLILLLSICCFIRMKQNSRKLFSQTT